MLGVSLLLVVGADVGKGKGLTGGLLIGDLLTGDIGADMAGGALATLLGSYPADLGGGIAAGGLNAPGLGLCGIFALSVGWEAVLDMLVALFLWGSGTAGAADLLSGCVIAAVLDLVFLACKGSGLLAGAVPPARGTG